MNKIVAFSLTIGIAGLLISCNMFGSSPEKVFKTVGLNSNKIPKNFKRTFDEIRAQKRNGTLPVVNGDSSKKEAMAEAFVTIHYTTMLTKDIEQIEALSIAKETEPIIEAGLDMFQYAHKIFNDDYLKIAKMIDDEHPDDMIDVEIEKLENTKGVILEDKYFKTMDLLIPYAEKHHVEYKTISIPSVEKYKTR